MRWLTLGLVLAPLSGCAVVGDLLNPGFVLGLGLDPATITPPEGTVLVAFNNTTPYPAYFRAYYLVDQNDASRDSRNFSVVVEGGEVENEVIECPVGRISPGTLFNIYSVDPEESVDPVAVITYAASGETIQQVIVEYDVSYPVDVGTAFQCGDVVEIRLSEAAAFAEAEVVVTVSVIPGR
ncbi:MAG: hypothetical protein KAY37_04355 [Phycisphaerae bacterium]|nr:hypothetical protein [Phycisphaerae bacterium]